jgi:CDP-diacylglycerol---glycerol-3-phosphate 3-phosphatidyltransferase
MSRTSFLFVQLITLSRVAASLTFVILAVNNSPRAALLVYIYALFSDFADGMAARRLESVSEGGALIDLLSDKVLTVLSLSVALLQGVAILPCLLVIIREVSLMVLRTSRTTNWLVPPIRALGVIAVAPVRIGTGLLLIALILPAQTQLLAIVNGLFWISAAAGWAILTWRVFFNRKQRVGGNIDSLEGAAAVTAAEAAPSKPIEALPEPSLTIRDELMLAQDWFKVHVTYRAAVQRYLLLSSGILAVAYVNLLEKDRSAAAILGALGAIATTAFVLLEIITNTKIQKAKAVVRRILQRGGVGVSEESPSVFELFGGGESWADEGFQTILFHDPVWIGIAEAALVCGFVIASAYALSESIRWILGFAAASFTGMLSLSVAVWRGASRR